MKEDEDKRICTKEPMSSKELIEIILNKLQIDNTNDCNLASKWNKIAEGDLAQHLTIKEIKFNTLVVIADHPAWAQKANLKKKIILRKINKFFPSMGINSIKIICR